MKTHNVPINRGIYCNEIGETREENISEVLETLLDSPVEDHKVSENGADVTVLYHRGLSIGFEVTNENMGSYIDTKRAERMRKNLEPFDIKVVITSFDSMTEKAEEILDGIPTFTIGFQTIPKKYYHQLKNTFRRRLNSKRTLRKLRNSIISILHVLGVPLTPIYGPTDNQHTEVRDKGKADSIIVETERYFDQLLSHVYENVLSKHRFGVGRAYKVLTEWTDA